MIFIIVGGLIGFLIGGIVGGAPFGPIGAIFGSVIGALSGIGLGVLLQLFVGPPRSSRPASSESGPRARGKEPSVEASDDEGAGDSHHSSSEGRDRSNEMMTS
jgi:hypothetical protein